MRLDTIFSLVRTPPSKVLLSGFRISIYTVSDLVGVGRAHFVTVPTLSSDLELKVTTYLMPSSAILHSSLYLESSILVLRLLKAAYKSVAWEFRVMILCHSAVHTYVVCKQI